MGTSQRDQAPDDAADAAALVVSVANGDRDALARLYDRFSGPMLALGLRMLGNRRDAEDVLHDVFVEVWRRASSYDRKRGSVFTWLMVRMRSRTLDRARRAGVRRTANLDEIAQMPAASTDPERAADQRRIFAALEQLPDAQRQVIELAYFGGLAASAIAERLGIPVGTVKSRTAAALEKLRGQLRG